MTRRLLYKFLVTAAIVGALLFLLGGLLDVLQALARLRQTFGEAPPWFLALTGVTASLLLGFGGWLLWALLRRPRPRGRKPEPLDEAALRERLEAAEQAGVDVEAARRELAELTRRRGQGTVYLALFGEISSGKSSLVGALLPGAEAETGVAGGTTTRVTRYHWRREGGDEVVLVDVPGINQVGRDYDRIAAEEAQRAHIVIFVADGDLTREQYAALEPLLAPGKPVILALNKVDRYSEADQAAIRDRLRARFADRPQVQVVEIATRPVQMVTTIGPDGGEAESVRELPPRLDALRHALQAVLDEKPEVLERLRDTAVFELAAQKLEQSQARHRRRAADDIVKKYTRRAVLGGMAAMGPGTDIVIQGVLATGMVRGLCELYEVPVREVQLEKFFSLSQQQLRKTLPLILAIVGNAAKAFPGMGTLAGGLIHAVAYGLIFDTLGRAVVATLESRGELRPAPASILFREKLGEDLEARARSLARLALEARTGKKAPD